MGINRMIDHCTLATAILFSGNVLAERDKAQGAKNFISSDTEMGRRMTGTKLGNRSGHTPHYGKKQAEKDKKRWEREQQRLKEKDNALHS